MTLPMPLAADGKPVRIRFPFTVEPARFVARPNRFLVLAQRGSEDEGEMVKVHCADPGRLRELLVPGARLYISRSAADAKARRTQYDLRFVVHSAPIQTNAGRHGAGQLVSVDTRLPNQLVALALMRGALSLWPHSQTVKPEAAGPLVSATGVRSRFDFCVMDETGLLCWVEVKSATLVEEGLALFPDAPTARGRRHLNELTALVARGLGRGAVIFVVQRSDATALAAHRERDPAFADALCAARQAGVELYAYTCSLTTEEITLGHAIPIRA